MAVVLMIPSLVMIISTTKIHETGGQQIPVLILAVIRYTSIHGSYRGLYTQ